MKTTRWYVMVAVVGFMLALGNFPALAAGGYGNIIPNGEVTQAFEGYQVDPDLNYYHSGSSYGPDVIIGVKKAISLDNPLWQKCTSTADFKKHVSGMQNLATGEGKALYGFVINDERGMKIGVEYSLLNTPTSVRRVSEKAVDITTPSYQDRLSTLYNSK